MSLTYKNIVDELEWKRPWLFKYGIEDIEIIDRERAKVILGNGKAYLFDNTNEGSKLQELRNYGAMEPIDEDEWRLRFSYVLEERMKEKDIDKVKLSKLTGLTQAYINKLIRGYATPSAWQIYELSRALECDVADLEFVPYDGI